jgi:peptidoglycan/LPS O-acetylase OafA/YrhL
MRLAMFGNVGVDAFFVLTGLWATVELVTSLEQAAASHADLWCVIRNYLARRAIRLLPAYASAVALVALAIDHSPHQKPHLRRNHDVVFEYCPGSLPLNFLFLNNAVGFGGCGVHFWSLSVQMHFFLVFPFMLMMIRPAESGFRQRVAILAGTAFVVGMIIRLIAGASADVRLPLPPYAHAEDTTAAMDVAVRYYHTLYFATPARICNFAAGVLLALVMLNAQVTLQLRRWRLIVALACCSVLWVTWRLVFSVKLYGRVYEQRQWKHPVVFAALAYHGSPLYSASVVALLLLVSLRVLFILPRILRSMPFRFLAKVHQ